MKALIVLGLFVISFIVLLIITTPPIKAGPCDRYLDTSKWECYKPPTGNCCDDAVIYG